jgi:hypothetical protein
VHSWDLRSADQDTPLRSILGGTSLMAILPCCLFPKMLPGGDQRQHREGRSAAQMVARADILPATGLTDARARAHRLSQEQRYRVP